MSHPFKKLALASVLSIGLVSSANAQNFGIYTTSQNLDFVRLIAEADYAIPSGPAVFKGSYFSDSYEINLIQMSDLSFSVSEITTGSNVDYDVTFLNFGLFDNNGNSVTTTTNLSAGTYFLMASGKLAGSLGGDFNVSFNIAPVTTVPEGDTNALMLAGLGLMGFVSRRKAK